MDELISVVLPVYNVEPYLHRCVDSVLSQTYSRLEILLVDDGSTDNSGAICDEYAAKDDRIKVIHKENGGLSDARNVGIRAATGRYVTVIDSDDYVSEDYVEVLYNAVKETGCPIAFGGHRTLYESGSSVEKANGEESVLSAEETLRRILYDIDLDLSAWSKLYERRLFDTVEYPVGRLFEDAATTYLLVDLAERVAVVSKPLYMYMVRTTSITGQAFSPRKMDLITSTREMTDYVVARYPALTKAAARRLMFAYLSTLSKLAMSRQRFPKEQEELMTYIRAHRKEILQDPMIPRRDRLALHTTKLGFWFFKLVWRSYNKLRGRS
ncbi:MAG: glycosyltransferase family 2 protein [Ruminococcaceae bacterium]|nr:glycosyltransferase family 2 protein [Oscillospiraceae bacterium]